MGLGPSDFQHLRPARLSSGAASGPTELPAHSPAGSHPCCGASGPGGRRCPSECSMPAVPTDPILIFLEKINSSNMPALKRLCG